MPSDLDFPPIYLLSAHLETEELHDLEGQIPTLTYNPDEADVIIGNISRPERALFELRRRNIDFQQPELREDSNATPGAKRRKISAARSKEEHGSTLKVARLRWLTDSLRRGRVLPVDDYLVLEVERGTGRGAPQRSQRVISVPASPSALATGQSPVRRLKPLREGDKKPPPLLHKSTSDEISLPPVPETLLNTPYSCQRPTCVDIPNASFVDELKKIRKTRILAGDAVGVRAYSTSIASVAAYPHPLQSQLGE